MSNVSLSQEMYYLKHYAQNGEQTREVLVSTLEKLNNTDGNVSSLYDGENIIRANNLLTYNGAENILKNKINNVLEYSPVGKPTTEKRKVDIFVDEIPKKESMKKLPMTNRGIYNELEYMDRILDKLIGPKTKDWSNEINTSTQEVNNGTNN